MSNKFIGSPVTTRIIFLEIVFYTERNLMCLMVIRKKDNTPIPYATLMKCFILN